MNVESLPLTENDASLITAVMSGDTAAFGRLYDRYAPLIRAICSDTTLNLSQSQDLCQETFLRAYRKLGELREPEKFPVWLIAIARFVCREWKRSKARDRHRYVGLAPADQSSDASFSPGEAEELSELRRSIAQLPQDQQLALHLFYLKEQGVDDARRVMNLSRSGFYNLLERARQDLARLLEPRQEDLR